MKKSKIAIYGDSSAEGIISLAPAIRALATKYPEIPITLVAPEAMREVAALLPGLSEFSSRAVEADVAFSQSAAVGSEALDWKIYLESTLAHSAGNPFHRIDLLRKLVGADLVDVNFELTPPHVQNESLPESLNRGDNGLRIAICAAGLEGDEIESILNGISRLAIPREVYLVGTIKEKKKSSEIISRWDGQLAIHDLCGHLSFSTTAHVLRNADVCISAPGVETLLSSGFGTFTVCVDPQPNRGPLHYPYGHGHLVIQNTSPEFFLSATAGLVSNVLEHAVSANSGNVPTLDQWQAFADSKIDDYLGRVRFLATQRIETLLGEESSLTELYLRPLIYLGSDLSDVMETFYRLLWEHSLNARTFTSNEIEILHQDAIPSLRELLQPLEKLFELSRFGRNYCQLVKKALEAGDVALAKQESTKVQEVEELVYALGQSFTALRPICDFHVRCQAHMPELDPAALADEMSEVFADLQSRVLVLLDLAKTLFHTTLQNESARRADSSPQEA